MGLFVVYHGDEEQRFGFVYCSDSRDTIFFGTADVSKFSYVVDEKFQPCIVVISTTTPNDFKSVRANLKFCKTRFHDPDGRPTNPVAAATHMCKRTYTLIGLQVPVHYKREQLFVEEWTDWVDWSQCA